jgi:hypothetical protein
MPPIIGLPSTIPHLLKVLPLPSSAN